MNKERDLMPWILGGLSLATAAVAITVANRIAAPDLQRATVVAQAPPAAVSLPDPAPPPAAVPTPQPDPATTQPPLAQTASEPQVESAGAPSGQIWECTTRGVKTFSNNPCGEKSTLLDVGPINTMNSTPPVRYARAYGSEPRYAPAYTDPGAYAEQDPYADQGAAESGGNSYAVVQGFAFIPRRRPEHPHRPPHHHDPAPVQRRY
jgi:hypothetical protein